MNLNNEIEKGKIERDFALSMLKLLADKDIIARCKYKSAKLMDMIDNIIDIDDIGNKEKESKYLCLDDILDDFANILNKQF